MDEREYQEYARRRQLQLEHDLGFHSKYPKGHKDCGQCQAKAGK